LAETASLGCVIRRTAPSKTGVNALMPGFSRRDAGVQTPEGKIKK
jgi:hypothetical protein